MQLLIEGQNQIINYWKIQIESNSNQVLLPEKNNVLKKKKKLANSNKENYTSTEINAKNSK